MARQKDPITAEDLMTFRDKLGSWGRSLPPQESAVVNVMLESAGEASHELTQEALECVTGGGFGDDPPVFGGVDDPGKPKPPKPISWLRTPTAWVRM
jgi:hypothetical protein